MHDLTCMYIHATGNSEQSIKKPRLAVPSGSIGVVGPALSGESETTGAPSVSKQEEQMLRVCLHIVMQLCTAGFTCTCSFTLLFLVVSSFKFCG